MIPINSCSRSDLTRIPGIGDRMADRILEVRSAMGEISREIFCSIPYLRTTPQMLDMIDFSPANYTPFTSASDRDFEEQRFRSRESTGFVNEDEFYLRYEPKYENRQYMGGARPRQSYMKPDYDNRQDMGGARHRQQYPRPDYDSPPQQRYNKYPKPVGNFPKALRFDGTTDWKSFYIKFSKYAESMYWSAVDCRNNLCWVLEGKASEFFTLLQERDEKMEYFDIITKMEKRFGSKELVETSQARLRTAKQYPNEKLVDWADRVLSLATKAYKDLPDEFLYQQAILTICQGATDKETGQYVSNQRLKTIDEVIDKFRWYQLNRKAIYGDSIKRETITGGEGDSDEGPPGINRAGPYSSQSTGGASSKPFGARISNLEQDFMSLKSEMDTLKANTNHISDNVGKILSLLTEKKRRNPSEKDNRCFGCGQEGHFRARCPKNQADVNQVQEDADMEILSELFDEQDLNCQRSENEA